MLYGMRFVKLTADYIGILDPTNLVITSTWHVPFPNFESELRFLNRCCYVFYTNRNDIERVYRACRKVCWSVGKKLRKLYNYNICEVYFSSQRRCLLQQKMAPLFVIQALYVKYVIFMTCWIVLPRSGFAQRFCVRYLCFLGFLVLSFVRQSIYL